MGRSHVTPIEQPDDYTCGPASLKVALEIFGQRKSLASLITLCKTNKNGTSTKHMIEAANKLGLSVLAVEYGTLKHIQSALKHHPKKPRAVIVSYLSELTEEKEPHEDSGHWTTVFSYSASQNKIIVFESGWGMKKSYHWQEFRSRWMDYDLQRRKVNGKEQQFKFVRHWQPQLMLVLAQDPKHLPKFKISSSKIFTP